MSKKQNKSIAILIVMILCLVSLYQNEKETYASNSNKYLVLIQQKDGSWKEYKNMIEISESGILMIKAKTLSKALGFTYQYKSNGTFVVQRSSNRYNTYTKNSKIFTYMKNGVSTKKSASYKAYVSKSSNYYVCQASTLNTLLYLKYFDKAKTNNGTSYSGIMCYSKYKSIPSTVPVSNLEPTEKPTPTPKPEPATISIEGVEFPVRDSFLTVKKSLSDWGGTSPLWYELELEVDGSIIKTTDLVIGTDKIEFTHTGSGSDGVYLSKTSDGYKITISVKLQGSVTTDQNAAVVKAMIVTISSKPSSVYKAIFESFTTDQTHGINEKTYVTIGDCKIKIKVKNGEVIYYIKKA